MTIEGGRRSFCEGQVSTRNPWDPIAKRGRPEGYCWDLADALVHIGVFKPTSPQTFVLDVEFRRSVQKTAAQLRKKHPREKLRNILYGAILLQLVERAPQPVKIKHLCDLANMAFGALKQHITRALQGFREEFNDGALENYVLSFKERQALAEVFYLEGKKIPELAEILDPNYTFEEWLREWINP